LVAKSYLNQFLPLVFADHVFDNKKHIAIKLSGHNSGSKMFRNSFKIGLFGFETFLDEYKLCYAPWKITRDLLQGFVHAKRRITISMWV